MKTAKLVKQMLRKSFRKEETFVAAIKKIKATVEVDPKTERFLRAKWNVWELYGDNIDD